MNGGRVLVVLLITIGLLGSLATGQPMYWRLLFMGVTFLLVSWILANLPVWGLKVKRQARSLRAGVGDIFEEHFEVFNSGRLTCLWIEVANQSRMPGVSGSRLLTAIGGRQKRTYLARTWLVRRGGFLLGPTVLTTGDPFGLFRTHKYFPATDSLVVLPMIVEITAFLSPPGLLPGGKVIRRKALDITPHAAGVREYAPGDPMKRIHWPTTMRRQQLMVKEFEQDPQAEVWLFLDAQKNIHFELPYEIPMEHLDSWLFSKRPTITLPPSTLEYAISIAASLAHYFIQQKRAVGFIAADRVKTVIPAERSMRQEDKILETLAFLDAEGEFPLVNVVAAQAGQLPQGSSAILITPSVQPEILSVVDDLQRRRLRPVVVFLAAESFGGPGGSENLARSLMERNVPVCLIYCNADLAQALSAFAADPMYQDVITWRRPILNHLT